ncbi:MAG: hypothetical protein BAA00_18535 [Parageobacillus thermoglucosidasius]|nr:MAG: hypothetical protein BAA00_18535 [Parageobacillus thermoglucosidasius]
MALFLFLFLHNYMDLTVSLIQPNKMIIIIKIRLIFLNINFIIYSPCILYIYTYKKTGVSIVSWTHLS